VLKNALNAILIAAVVGAVLCCADLLRLRLLGLSMGAAPSLVVCLEYSAAVVLTTGIPVCALLLVGHRFQRQWMAPFSILLEQLWFAAGLVVAWWLGSAKQWLSSIDPTSAATFFRRPQDALITLGCAVGGFLIGAAITARLRRQISWTLPSRRLVQSLALLLLLSGLIGWSGLPSRSSIQGPRPNVVLVVLDTVRADEFLRGIDDPKVGARLKPLLAQGTLYTNATATSTWTLPTHASIFTGLMPRSHGARLADGYLEEGIPTLAELLRKEDYRTACITNNPWISAERGLVRGFEQVWDPGSWVKERPTLRTLLAHLRHQLAARARTGSPVGDKNARYSIELAREWIDTGDAHQPFFLFINLMNAHLPYLPPSTYSDRFFDPGEPDPEMFGHLSGVLDPSLNKTNRLRADGLRRLYRASIACLDDVVSELASALEERALLDDTMFIVVSDHGEHIGEHRQLGHGGAPWRTTTWIPLWIRYPRVAEGDGTGRMPERDGRPVSQVDLLPTVLDVVSVHPGGIDPGSLQGSSLREDSSREFVFSEFSRDPSDKVAMENRDRDGACVVEGDGSRRLLWTSKDGFRLFQAVEEGDLERDVTEEQPELFAQLKSRLENWMQSTMVRSPKVREWSEQEKRNLEAIGYVEER